MLLVLLLVSLLLGVSRIGESLLVERVLFVVSSSLVIDIDDPSSFLLLSSPLSFFSFGLGLILCGGFEMKVGVIEKGRSPRNLEAYTKSMKMVCLALIFFCEESLSFPLEMGDEGVDSEGDPNFFLLFLITSSLNSIVFVVCHCG